MARHLKIKTMAGAVALLLALASVLAWAQDETAPPAAEDTAAAPAAEEAAPAEPAAASEVPADGTAAEGAAEEVSTAPAQPKPAEKLPNAASAVTLDVTYTGESYVAVGERGHILLSADGKTWTQSDSPVRATLTGVFFVDASTGWAVGHDAAILNTTDGGKSWALQNWAPELEKPLLDLYFFDASRGIAVGAYGLYLATADGGKSWTTVANEVTAEEWHFNSIIRLGDGSMLIAGEAGGLAHSKDEAATWVRLESPYEGTFFGALPRGDKGAMLFGLRGNVFVADAAGAATAASWRQLKTDTVQSFLGGTTMPDGSVLLVGINGIIAKGDSNSLALAQNPAATSLSAVVPAAGGGALAVGEKGGQILTP
ncbi:MAG: WD40/YVTN/BNR-like repeat-containing protein [Nevskiales bacterium]